MNAASGRLDGLDVARALAILGMFVVHSRLVLDADPAAAGSLSIVFDACEGRAAATFVTLAGCGVALLLDRLAPAHRARVLGRRALFLGVLGVVNLAVWPGDILRLYGVALAFAPLVARWPARWLLVAAGALIAAFPPLAALVTWEARWDFATLEYRGLWEPVGFARNLVVDGFRPVVPWLAFFFVGMALARLDLRDRRVQARLIAIGAALAVGAPLVSFGILAAVSGRPDIDPELAGAVLGVGSMPPMPLFAASAIGTALLVIGACLRAPARALAPLVHTGRLALTWYLGHIVAIVLVFVAGANHRLSSAGALLAALGAFAVVVTVATVRRGAPGLLERALRRAGGACSPCSASSSSTARHVGPT